MKQFNQLLLRPVLATTILAPLLASVCAGAPADKFDRPDPLIEASTLAVHADSLTKVCSYKEAEEWQQRAITTASKGRYPNRGDRDTAGALSGQLQIGLITMQHQRRQLDEAVVELSRLIRARRLVTASDRLRDLDPPECDQRLRSIQRELSRQLATAKEFVRRGDVYLSQGQATSALHAFEQAQAINCEQPPRTSTTRRPDLSRRIAEAHQLKHSQSRAGVRVAKTVTSIVLLTGIGAGGYLYYRDKQKNLGR